MKKLILDATCGHRAMWYKENKNNPYVLFCDMRNELNPEFVIDYRNLPFPDESFYLIVFDPPHIIRKGGMDNLSGIMREKYGALDKETWQDDLRSAFNELWRVLKPNGALVLKFCDVNAPFEEVLSLAPVPPMFGTTTKVKSDNQTRFFVFFKPCENEEAFEFENAPIPCDSGEK